MRYLGSKNRLSKHIAPIIQELIDTNNIDTYYEPFVGGCNLIDKIKCKNKIGNDSHKYLITMWKAIQSGWIPPEMVTESEYKHIRDNKNLYPDYLVGAVGFCASFGSKWFGGYARTGNKEKHRKTPYEESLVNILKQADHIKDVVFLNGDYKDTLPNIKNAVIYCDPPYANTTSYAGTIFDTDEFWEWCRVKAQDNIVLVSEYNAPKDAECIFEKQVKVHIAKTCKSTNRVEKLYRVHPKRYRIGEMFAVMDKLQKIA